MEDHCEKDENEEQKAKNEQQSPPWRQGLIIFTMFAIISSLRIVYSVIASFLPIHIKQHHSNISSMETGLILAMFDISIITCTPFIGKVGTKYDKRTLIAAGYLICVISSTAFALLDNDYDRTSFFLLAVFLRFMQGFGDAIAINSIYSAVAFEYQEIREIIFGVLEAAYGLGFAAGPLIGQILYSQFGFQECFVYLSYILLVPMILIWFLKFTRKESTSTAEDTQIAQELKYRVMLNNRRTMATVCVLFGCTVCMIFYLPLLANQLIFMKVPISQIGYFLVFGTISYVFFGPIVGALCKRFEEKRYITLSALFTTSLALFFFGPSLMFGLPQTIELMCVGMMLTGLSLAMLSVPIIPEIIKSTQEALKIEESRSLCDKASAISITTTSLGMIFAPIVGGTLYDHFGFQGTTDILMIAAFVQCVIYFTVVIRPLIISKNNLNTPNGPHYKYSEVPKAEEECEE